MCFGMLSMHWLHHVVRPLRISTLQSYGKEFIGSHFKSIERHARGWVFQRLKDLYLSWKHQLTMSLTSGRQINATQQTIRIDHYLLMILNKLLDLYVEAVSCIHVRYDGLIFRVFPDGWQIHRRKSLRS